MLRRMLLAGLMAFGLVATTAGAAQAWDLIHSRSGYDRVALRAWTRNYNQVAYVADHAGTRIRVTITVTCNNGDFFQDSWVDGGERFRFILRGLGDSGRCDHVFKVDARRSDVRVDLALYARG